MGTYKLPVKTSYWDEPIETASPEKIRKMQLRRLKSIVKYVYESNDVYRRELTSQGIKPEDIRALEDVKSLPFMDKGHLRENYPLGYCCVDQAKIREVHMSSGFTGRPVVIPYTEKDLDQWATCMARCYRMAGIEEGGVIQITPSFGLFNGGFGFYHGARKAGLFVIPTGPGNTLRQIRLANDFKVKAITAVASYGIRIMEVMKEKSLSIPSLKKGLFGAEVFSQEMKKRLQTGMGIEIFDIYGMTETGGVGTTGMDCPAHDGIHVWEDHYLVEVIDPDTRRSVPDGQEGELVFTALTRYAFPVIRFRSGDLSRIRSRKRCECERTHLRIDYIKGRVDNMIIIKGINFFPAQVEEALMSIPGVKEHYQITVKDRHGVKDAELQVEAEEGVTSSQIEKKLEEALGFSLNLRIFKPGELERKPGKAERVIYIKEDRE
jgi:phenylacetate-CoA ligase